MNLLKRIILPALTLITAVTSACGTHGTPAATTTFATLADSLRDSLTAIATTYPAEIGIAVITSGGDTVTVNNADKYPLMSVFKLHQAIALCHRLEERGSSLDTGVTINRSQLNPDTWSPMLKDFTAPTISITIRDLLRYTLTQSDNNASNYLFENIQPVAAADNFIATLIPRATFRLSVTEADMWLDHSRAADNHSSPLGVALLLDRLYTDSLLARADQDFICSTLRQCTTGTDRIAAPLAGKPGVTIGHKTGSGYRNPDGSLAAHNDAAFITMPDGRHYTLAVLVKDFKGSDRQASEAIARISSVVYAMLSEHHM